MDSSVCSSSTQDQIQEDFLLPDLNKDGPKIYLQNIREVVDKHKGSQIKLKKTEYSFKVACFTQTSYKDCPDVLDEWEQYYLEDHMFMVVIGVLEEFCTDTSNNELVLMVCEDEKVYGYADHWLHLVANSLKELFKDGLQFPGIKRYYRGEIFDGMTEDELDSMKKSEVYRKSMMEHAEFVASIKDSFLANLDILMGRSSGKERPAQEGEKPVHVPE